MLLKTLAAAGTIALLAGSANAGIAFYSFGTGAPIVPLITNFTGDTAGDQPTTAAFGDSWVAGGTATIFDESVSGLGAEPATSGSTFHTGNYLVVQNGQTETLTIAQPDIKEMFVYIGSLDAFNGISFNTSGGTVSYSGAQLGLVSGQDNGSQPGASTNGIFEFAFNSNITGVTFTSGGESFEISSIGDAVPEPTTWALMLAGVGGIGVAMRARRKPVAAAA